MQAKHAVFISTFEILFIEMEICSSTEMCAHAASEPQSNAKSLTGRHFMWNVEMCENVKSKFHWNKKKMWLFI